MSIEGREQTPREWNSAKSKLRKAIALLDEAADLFAYNSTRRREIIVARQKAEEVLTEMES